MQLVDEQTIATAVRDLDWDREDSELVKVVRRHDFAEALAYVNAVGQLAESAGHHPDIDLRWNTVTLRLSTHSLGGITDADLTLAEHRHTRLNMKHYERFNFVGVDALGSSPHIVADGAARPHTVFTLSHWPGTPTPQRYWRDLSAEIAYAYIADRGRRRDPTDLVTCDHLDEDGLASLFFLCVPDVAIRHFVDIVGLARVGDFGVITRARDAQLGLIVAAYMDPDRSPLAAGLDAQARRGLPWASRVYAALLEELPAMLSDIDQYRPWWEEDFALVTAARAAINAGDVTIDEDRDLGLAVVRVPHDLASLEVAFGHNATLPIHRWAIHSATNCPRVLVAVDRSYTYYDRYESWVRYVSAEVPRRRSLLELGAKLNEMESGADPWRADPPSALVATLTLSEGAKSSLSFDQVRGELREYLRSAPAAWDPFR